MLPELQFAFFAGQLGTYMSALYFEHATIVAYKTRIIVAHNDSLLFSVTIINITIVCFLQLKYSHIPFVLLSSSMTYHWIVARCNTTGVISGADTACTSRVHEFTSGYSWISQS